MNSFSRKAVAVGLTVATVAWAAGATLSVSAAGLSQSQIDAILSMLQAFGADQSVISNVQAALSGQQVSGGSGSGTGGGSSMSCSFAKDLTLGSKGPDVKALQQFLNSKGYTVAKSGSGSPGNESEYFGPATKAALAKFQQANNISPAAGYFGPKTRAAVNGMCTVTTGGETGGGVTLPAGFNVSLAETSPKAGTIVAGQTVADLAHFTFSNGNSTSVTVTSLTVTRIGVSSDNSLLNVYLYQGNNRLTDGASVVNGKVTFTNSSGLFTVPGNSTVTVGVRADIVSGISGQSVSFAIMSASDVVSSVASVGGSFPVSGNLMTVANVSDLLQVTMPGTPTGAGSTINAGTVNAIVWSQPINVSQRTAYLRYVRFRQIGSVQSDALQNLKLYIDGSQVSSANAQSDGTVVFDMTSQPVSLNTGSHSMELHADIVKGSSRNFSFSIQTPSDIVIYDSNYGVAVSPSGATFPMSAAQTTINSGSVSITTDPNFTSNQTLLQASNVTLGQWSAKAYGEDVRVGQWKVTLNLTGTSTSGNYINNIAIYVNGAQVGSAQNWSVGSSTNGSTTLTFGSGNLFTMVAGQQYVVAVKGDTSLASSTSAVLATLTEVANQSQGLTSYTTFPASDTPHAGQSLSLTGSSLTISVNPSYGSQTVGSNVSKAKIGSYVLQASNIDSVQVTQVTIGLGGSLALTNLSNLYISENTQGVYPQSQNTFAVNFTIGAGQSKVLDVFADIGNATGTVTTTLKVSARAVTSNTQVGNATPVNGQTVTIGTGTLGTPTLVQSLSLPSQYVAGETANQQLAVYNFSVPSGGGVNIMELGFTVNSGVASSTITRVSVTYSGVTRSGILAYSGATGTVTISDLNIPVPGNNYAGIYVPVSVDYAQVPTVSPSGVTSTLKLTSVKYTSGGTTVTNSVNVASNQVMLVGAYPVISVNNPSGSFTFSNDLKLFEFTVNSNSQTGAISLGTTTFVVNTTNISTSSLTGLSLYANNSPISGSSCNATGTDPWTVTCTFPNDYRVSGSGPTFALHGTVGGTPTPNAQQWSVTTKLDTANKFSWNDVSGGNVGPYTTANSTFLYNYPTVGWTIRN